MNNDKVVFFKDSHTYWLGERKIPSVGSYINQYFPEFMEDFWLTHGILKDKFGDEYMEHYRKFKTMTPDASSLFSPFIGKMSTSEFISMRKELSEKWERKKNEFAFKGTQFHDKQEKLVYEQGFIVNPWDRLKYPVVQSEKIYHNEAIVKNLIDLPDGAHPELLIFDLDLWLAGQADEVYIQTIKGKRYIDINDHKTNEKKPSKSDPNRCLPPFEDEYASKDFRYTMQINIYAHMLKRAGFIPRNLGYTFYTNYDFDQSTLIDVRNIQEKIAATLC